jgi:hypothetical protein
MPLPVVEPRRLERPSGNLVTMPTELFGWADVLSLSFRTTATPTVSCVGLPRSCRRRLRFSEALIGKNSKGGDGTWRVPLLPSFTELRQVRTPAVNKQTTNKQTADSQHAHRMTAPPPVLTATFPSNVGVLW